MKRNRRVAAGREPLCRKRVSPLDPQRARHRRPGRPTRWQARGRPVLYGPRLGLWRQRDQCTGPATGQSIAPDVIQTTWPSCIDGTRVVNYRIIGGGHTWPDAAVPSGGPRATTHSIDAGQAMAVFFAVHPWQGVGP
jgi:poly(3-hydroxybutyrate) depolymerase